MKYGRIIFGTNPKQGKNQYGNLGDYYQSHAVENLYDYMGIGVNDRAAIKRAEISSYRGEKVVLPLQGCFVYTKGMPVFPVSPDIIPVFFGYHGLSLADRKSLRGLPEDVLIGCRDEPTYRLMKKLGKNAFLSGCLTAAMPRREKEPKDTKVFLADAPDGIEKFLPEHFKERFEYISQSFFLDNTVNEDESYKKLGMRTASVFARYRDEATLIVTSRLHVAVPCTAMGIPVILARTYFDERYSWVEKYLPLYTPEKFKSIDWDFKAPFFEGHKRDVLDAAASMINGSPESVRLVQKVHDFYMDRDRALIKTPLKTRTYHFMKGVSPKTADFVREVMLSKFTVETSRNKQNVKPENHASQISKRKNKKK